MTGNMNDVFVNPVSCLSKFELDLYTVGKHLGILTKI